MKGLGRNLKFWIITLEKYALGMLITGIVVASVFVASSSDENIWRGIMRSTSAYLIMAVPIINCTIAFSCINTYFPLTVSLGSDRKSSFVAMLIAQHLIMLELFVIGILPTLFTWFDGDVEPWLRLVEIALVVSLFLMGIGMLTSIISLRFGRNVGIAAYIGFLLLTMLAGCMAIGWAVGGTVTLEFPWGDLLTKCCFLALGIGFEAVMIGALYHNIRKKDLLFA